VELIANVKIFEGRLTGVENRLGAVDSPPDRTDFLLDDIMWLEALGLRCLLMRLLNEVHPGGRYVCGVAVVAQIVNDKAYIVIACGKHIIMIQLWHSLLVTPINFELSNIPHQES
jgi:hypothetical protein